MLARALAIASLTAALGCDGSLTSLQGIYEVSSWTANPSGCDQEGPSILESQPSMHLFVRADDFFGVEFVNAVLCDGLEPCRTDAADRDTLYLGGYVFEEGSDKKGWTGATGLLGGDDCSGTITENTLTGEAGASIRIAQEAKSVTGVPRDEEDDCDFDAARAQAESQPCESLEVLTADFIEGL